MEESDLPTQVVRAPFGAVSALTAMKNSFGQYLNAFAAVRMRTKPVAPRPNPLKRLSSLDDNSETANRLAKLQLVGSSGSP